MHVTEPTSNLEPDILVDRLDISVRWHPPLAVLYELSFEEREGLESELHHLVEAAVHQFLGQYANVPGGVRYRVLRDAHGPFAQAVEFVRVVLEDLPVELAADLMSDISKIAIGAIGRTALGKLKELKRCAGNDEISPTLAIEPPADANPINAPPQDVLFDSGMDFAPTDRQLSDAPLVYIRTAFDVRSVSEDTWGRFADYGATPIPKLFHDSLYLSLDELIRDRLPLDYIEVMLEDRPPRASPLFPAFFVDLTDVLNYLRTIVPNEVVGALIAAGLAGAQRRLQTWIKSERLPAGTFHNTYSVEILELLCENYVRVKRHPRARLSVGRDSFNTRIEGGYSSPIDPATPMGWKIQVRSNVTSFEFIVDSTAKVLRLEFREAGKSSMIWGADLLTPELDGVRIPRHSR